MPLDEESIQALIKQLADDRNTYLESVSRTQNLLVEALTSAGAQQQQQTRLTHEALRRGNRTPSLDVESVLKSVRTGDNPESVTDDNESLFVHDPLQPDYYDEEGLRAHLQEFDFPDSTKQCLHNVLDNPALFKRKGSIFPETEQEAIVDQSDYTHYSIFDVGVDGAPVPIRSVTDDAATTRPISIWKKLSETNTDPNKKQAVGRIVVIREPSPLLFGAIHYTMHKHFDVDELFDFLVDDGPKLAHPHRAFAKDPRHKRAFHWTFEYFTIIGEGRKPMTWQLADKEEVKAEATHIPISRCSSVVALSLEGPPFGKVKNRDRSVKERFGDIFDPFSPWRVLSVQCYPDWKSDTESHDSTKHYVNGPEAFLVTLKAEYKDARKRLKEVYEAISYLVEPPTDFMFHQKTRDPMLFEDAEFTYSRRYHWAYHSLGIMNRDITEMVMAYRDAFKDSVWDGSNKIIWPGDASTSSRHSHWRNRMAAIRREFDHEVEELDHIRLLNREKMNEIVGLRDNLFSGTSVLESRKSVDNSVITIEQGRNIKLLTLVTIFFLPLTFVTSVFGMTNMPQNDNFHRFAWSTLGICLPTYIFIGSLNSKKGLEFWTRWTRKAFHEMGKALAAFLAWAHYHPKWAEPYNTGEDGSSQEKAPLHQIRGARRRNELSALQGLAARATFREDKYALARNDTNGTYMDEDTLTPPTSPKPRRESSSKGWFDRTDSFKPPTRSSTVKFSMKSETSGTRSPKSPTVTALPSPMREMPEEQSEMTDMPDLEKGVTIDGDSTRRSMKNLGMLNRHSTK